MKRRNIGVLTAELSDSYQARVWEGITEEALIGDEGVICFLGSRIDSPDAQEAAANAVYEMATPENISGLIVIAGAISTYAARERIQRLFDSHGSFPMVSIGVPVEGAGNISVDNRNALGELVDHIIDVHNRSQIAIIAGPRWHVESEQRRQAVEQRLKDHGLSLHPDLIFHGTFEPVSGRDAVMKFMESPQKPDAIISLNDTMALAALKELRKRKIRVPEDISLTGFDGLEETLYSTPPLTTVLQPLKDLGREAMRELRLMMNKGERRDIFLKCQPLYRQSCGCAPRKKEEDNKSDFHQSRIQAALRLEERERSIILREIGFSLSETFETTALLSRLREGLKRIGFNDGFLVLYSEDTNSSERTLLNIVEKAPQVFSKKVSIPPSRILPEGLLSTRSVKIWILVPLVFLDHALGYLVLPADSSDREVYEILAMQLASSLQGAQLLEEIRNHERSLEKEVVKRTQQISKTNQMLRKEIDKRIRLEAEVTEISRRTMERIGQDLHDDLSQYLAGIAMHASVLESRLKNEDQELRDGITTINRLLADSIERTKGIARGLFPVGLNDEGLEVVLRALAEATQTGTGIPITVTVESEWNDKDSEFSLEIYRIIQEALYNSVRHSNCKTVEIHLYTHDSQDAAFFVAEVIDDGKGITNENPVNGMGLKIMKYRAEKTGAELKIETGESGTRIRYILPIIREVL